MGAQLLEWRSERLIRHVTLLFLCILSVDVMLFSVSQDDPCSILLAAPCRGSDPPRGV